MVMVGLDTMTMGAAATPAALSHPASVAVAITSVLLSMGVRQVDSAHTDDTKLVRVEHVDRRIWMGGTVAVRAGAGGVCTHTHSKQRGAVHAPASHAVA